MKSAAKETWSASAEEQRAYRALESFPNRVARIYARLHNAVIDLVCRPGPVESNTSALNEILGRSGVRTDISDHLPILFSECVSIKPRLIVELGVRGGESTFVFERVAKLTDAKCVSVDIEKSERLSQNQNCIFVQSDDIEFAREFNDWCRDKGLLPEVDVLFVDTSHFFEHTMQEIEHWFPLLAPRAKVFFHDTNQRRIYFRNDGSIGVAWNNRGVMSALEKYFNRCFDEKKNFTVLVNGWSIKHYANCNGLTVLTREAGSQAS